jgi:DNA repair exonuclease SbcCD ATPase subunit
MKILKNEYTNTRIIAHKIIVDILNNFLFILYNMCPMKDCSNCGSQLSLGTEKFCPDCGQDLSKGRIGEELKTEGNTRGINISGTQGDVIGTGVSGSGNIIGKNIVVGDGTINVSEQRLTQIQNNEYAESLKQLSETINNQLNGRQIPEDKVKSINQSINELAEEVKDVKPGKEEEIDYVKQTNVEAKTASVIQKVLDVLPQAAETAATFTPLAPFSKLIGKGIQGIVDTIAKRKRS